MRTTVRQYAGFRDWNERLVRTLAGEPAVNSRKQGFASVFVTLRFSIHPNAVNQRFSQPLGNRYVPLTALPILECGTR